MATPSAASVKFPSLGSCCRRQSLKGSFRRRMGEVGVTGKKDWHWWNPISWFRKTYAQKLANELTKKSGEKTNVTAPNTYMWYNSAGRTWPAEMTPTGEPGEPGKMKKFKGKK